MSRRKPKPKVTTVRGMDPDLLDLVKEKMEREGIASRSDGSAVKWAATQFARALKSPFSDRAARKELVSV